MQDLSQAIDGLEREIVRGQWLNDVRDALVVLKAAESELTTTKAQSVQAAQERDAAIAAKADAEAGVDAAKDQAAAILADANAQAAAVADKAEADKATAKAQASSTLFDAKAKADSMLADADASKHAIAQQVSDAKANLSDVQASIQSAQSELDALTEKLARAKAAAAAMLG